MSRTKFNTAGLSPACAALAARVAASRWLIEDGNGFSGYYPEEHAKRIMAKHPEYTLTAPEA